MLKSLLNNACIVAVSFCAQCSSNAQESPFATVVAPDSKTAKRAPAHDPPQIVVAAAIDEDENLVLVNIRTIFIGFTGESYNDRSLSKTTLKDCSIFTAHGKRLSVDEARMQLAGKDTPILCSSWRTPLPAFYVSMFAPDTLHFVFPEQSPIWKKIEGPGRPFR